MSQEAVNRLEIEHIKQQQQQQQQQQLGSNRIGIAKKSVGFKRPS